MRKLKLLTPREIYKIENYDRIEEERYVYENMVRKLKEAREVARQSQSVSKSVRIENLKEVAEAFTNEISVDMQRKLQAKLDESDEFSEKTTLAGYLEQSPFFIEIKRNRPQE